MALNSRFLAVRAYATSAVSYFRDVRVPRKGDRVVIAMSGGVDSSVAARLLMDQDYDLSAVYMRNWDTRDESGSDSGGCEWKRDWEDVQRVCKLLRLPCEMVDLSREYWTRVFEPSLRVWESGFTPNPDVSCNREIKFGALVDRLMKHMAGVNSWFATGHYARKSWSKTHPGRPLLLRAADRPKDQTYYLSSISENSLARSLFPLAKLDKIQVRELAKQFKLPTATREESMGICFVGEKQKFSKFLSNYLPPNSGCIVNLSTGECIAKHQGLWSITIGQGAKLPGMAQKMYFAQKDIATNTAKVVPGADHPALYCRGIFCSQWHWIWSDSPPSALGHPQGVHFHMQYRHRMTEVPCSLQKHANGVSILFDKPQKAVALGQVAAVWDADICLGSGIIDTTI